MRGDEVQPLPPRVARPQGWGAKQPLQALPSSLPGRGDLPAEANIQSTEGLEARWRPCPLPPLLSEEPLPGFSLFPCPAALTSGASGRLLRARCHCCVLQRAFRGLLSRAPGRAARP